MQTSLQCALRAYGLTRPTVQHQHRIFTPEFLCELTGVQQTFKVAKMVQNNHEGKGHSTTRLGTTCLNKKQLSPRLKRLVQKSDKPNDMPTAECRFKHYQRRAQRAALPTTRPALVAPCPPLKTLRQLQTSAVGAAAKH